jgi:hypothetical protein
VLTLLLFVRFCRGVLNIVHGTHGTVNKILDHPDIAAVSFVGGDKAGRYIYERAAANGKRVQVRLTYPLSCSGNNATAKTQTAPCTHGVWCWKENVYGVEITARNSALCQKRRAALGLFSARLAVLVAQV